MEQIISAVTAVSNWLWGYPMLVLIVGGGIFLTVRLGFFQFVYFPYIMRQTFGSMLKKIGSESRADLQMLFGMKVYLELFVKVKEDWRNSPSVLKTLGYE